eukprot:scaffold28390_cov72-Phaeocystis_antarctica.AAC.2
MEGLARVRRDVMRSRRQGRLDDALVAAADEPTDDGTEAGGAGAADAAGGRGGAAGARKRRRGEARAKVAAGRVTTTWYCSSRPGDNGRRRQCAGGE